MTGGGTGGGHLGHVIGALAAQAAVETGAAVIVDTTVHLEPPRSDGDYRLASGFDAWSARRIAGSRFVDFVTEFSAAAPFHFSRPAGEQVAEVLARVGASDGVRPIAYDTRGGIWAARFVWIARSFGVPAQLLDGGLQAWADAALPLEHGAPDGRGEVGRRPPLAPPDPASWADLAEVCDIVEGRADGQLVCALGEAEYAGEAPTRYTRRGHIPGSVNLPARGLAVDGRLLDSPVLLHRLTGIDLDRPIIVYCGGGVSAALTAIQLRRAGARQVAVYDNSLEEWSADPSLPLVTGRPAADPAR